MKEFEELLTTWEEDGFKVELYSLGAETWRMHTATERPIVGYRLYDNGKLIFEGDQLRPSPMHGIDSVSTVMDLLAFLTLQPGDTDSEYFDEYTIKQMTWCVSDRAEELRWIQMEREEELNARDRI